MTDIHARLLGYLLSNLVIPLATRALSRWAAKEHTGKAVLDAVNTICGAIIAAGALPPADRASPPP